MNRFSEEGRVPINPTLLLMQGGRWLIEHGVVLLPVALLLIAAGLRFHNLGTQSLWNDEGNSLRLAQRPIADLLNAAAQDIHPPGYYLVLRGWIGLVGDSEFTLRALSALAGLLTVAAVYALGRALFAPGAGLTAAALVALNSFQIYYSQEARMYAALSLWTALSLWLLVRWIRVPRPQTAIALTLINAAGLYTHYTYPLVMLTQGLLFVAWLLITGQYGREWSQRWRRLIGFVLINAVTITLFLPLLPTALQQVVHWPHTGQAIDPGGGLAVVLRWLTYGNTSLDSDWQPYFWPGVFVIAAFLPDWLTKKPTLGWRLAVPWSLLIVVVGSLFALHLYRDANLKFLIPAQIGLALIIGRGAWLLWGFGSANLLVWREAAPRVIAAVGMLAIVYYAGNAIHNLYHSPLFARDDYRAMAAVIRADTQIGPRDLVILDAPNQIEAFSYYYAGGGPQDARLIGLPVGLGGNDTATHSALLTALDGARRVYVLFWGEDERDPAHVVESTLNTVGYATSSQWYGNVRLALYGLPDAVNAPGDLPAQPLNVDFGGIARLQGVSLTATSATPSDLIGVRLYWQADQPIAQHYKVFVQLLNADGQLVAQHDAEPVNYSAPTTSWVPGQTLRDDHGLALLPNLTAGTYRLIAGLYGSDGVRLTAAGQDHAVLGAITVR